MEKIIKKAIEGGWDKDNMRVYDCDGHDSQYINEIATVDKTFWQALGKSCGWKDVNYGYSLHNDTGNRGIHNKGAGEWEYHALNFHQINLTQGWDEAVKWLNILIKK